MDSARIARSVHAPRTPEIVPHDVIHPDAPLLEIMLLMQRGMGK